MSKDDWVRLFLHLPWGLLGVWLIRVDTTIGIMATSSMFIYEAFNDWRKGDASYKDVLGIVWGILLGGIIVGVMRL